MNAAFIRPLKPLIIGAYFRRMTLKRDPRKDLTSLLGGLNK